MKVSLSEPQIKVVEFLKASPGRMIRQNVYYYGQEIVEPDNKSVYYFTKPTLNALKRLGIIIPNEGKTGYVLNPTIKFTY